VHTRIRCSRVLRVWGGVDKEYEQHFIDSYRCISLEIDTKRYRNSVKREEPM
jgi:hypothetical protein